ncbi:MAG: AraC family transcriptional regulator [Pyrinomonadaceae bacterium]
MNQKSNKNSFNYLIKNREISGFKISETLYPPQLRQPRHTHKFASFSFVLAGNYLENYGRQTHSRQASTLIFHPPEESHAVDFENNVRILSVEFSFEKLSHIREHSVIFDASVSCRSEKTNRLGGRIYREFCQIDSFSMLAIEGLILELLAEASRCKIGATEKNIPIWLKKSKDFLHDNFTESLTLEEVAKIADVHPVHLSRVFREKYGLTIGEYVRRLRVEFASKQISSTEIPLSEIAHAAGFADQSHLNKIFKNNFGFTPSEYRKISRQS